VIFTLFQEKTFYNIFILISKLMTSTATWFACQQKVELSFYFFFTVRKNN